MRLFLIILIFSTQIAVFSSLKSTHCVPEPNQPIAEIVKQCRNNDFFGRSGPQIHKLVNMSQDDFDAIFSATEKLWANLEIVASSVKQMIFPKVEDFHFMRLVLVDHNPELEIIQFPVLKDFTPWRGRTSISHNPKLQEIDYPALWYFGINVSTIHNNSMLKSITLKGLRAVAVRDLIITQNPSLEIIELDGPGTKDDKPRNLRVFFDIRNILRIEDNPSLKWLKVTKREPIQKTLAKKMIIRNNRRLESVPYTFSNNNIEMRIEGNPKLEGKVLEGLRKAANDSWGRIQDYGECILDEKVKDLSILSDCLYIRGNLTLAHGARGRASGRIARIEGDVYSSDVPVDRLEFLLNADIYGQFESDLCDFDYSQFKSAKKGIGKSCRSITREATTETTTATSRRTEETTKRAIATEKETVGTTKMRVGTTAGIVIKEQTETATISTKMEETTTEEASTVRTNQFIPITDKLMESDDKPMESTPSEQKSEENDVVPRIVIICGVVTLAVTIVSLIAFLCHRKSKKKKKREESSNKSSSSKNSSSRPEVDSMKKAP